MDATDPRHITQMTSRHLRFRPAAAHLVRSLPFVLGWTAVPAVSQESPARIALIVGIDHYDLLEDGAASVPELRGCTNDAARAAELLVRRFGFTPEDTLVLRNEQATHQAIVQAFDSHLIRRAGRETEVVFWFSGHGSRIEEADSEEFEGQASTLVAWDSRTTSADLCDDEIYSLLQALCDRTERVTVITDCCHAGGVTRGAAASAPRSVSPSPTPASFARIEELWPAEIPYLTDVDPARRMELPVIHFAACGREEIAEEVAIDAGGGEVQWFGALSHYLTLALEQCEPGRSYEHLAREVSMRVSARFRDQTVEVEGPLSRTLFGGGFAPPLRGFPGTAQAGSRWLELQAGRFHLLAPAQLVTVRSLSGAELGQARIQGLDDYRCSARWEGVPNGLHGAMPVLAVPDPASLDRPVRLLAPNEGARAAWSEAMAARTSQPIEFVSDEAAGAEYRLDAAGGGGWELLALPQELVLWRSPDPPAQAAPSLAARVAAELRYRRLLDVGSAGGGIALRLEATAFSAGQFRRSVRGRFSAAPAARLATRRVVDHPDRADLVSLRFRLLPAKGQLPVHVAVLCVSEDRTVSLLYPSRHAQHEDLLEPGQEKQIHIEVFRPPGWPEDRPLHDRYLAIATASHVDFSALEESVSLVDAAALPIVAVRRGGGGALPEVLRAAFDARLWRSASTAPPAEMSFGVASVDLEIVAPPAADR